MKFSINWVKQYIPDLETGDIKDFTKTLISAGFDIESVETGGALFDKFVVGEVLEKEKHPDADKLSLCKVDAGQKDILSIVCGAPNVEKGQKVCVALVGAVVPVGEFEIKKSKIRGQLSEGMICSAKELGLSDDHSGIMVLDSALKNGTPFSEVIGDNDTVIEFGVTPNRGDMLSHFGAAREIAAALDLKFVIPKIENNVSPNASIGDPTPSSKNNVSPNASIGDPAPYIKVTIENPDLCKRFTARVIKNIKVAESPDWLKKSLTSIGLRPRNNIVDITNYVMFETGQPMHAFDLDKIQRNEIIIKTAKAGDKFTTLDSKERTLTDSSLMICDKEGYLSIAGIMGGENSEISDDTKNVLLEVAYFDPVNIRLTSKKLGIQSDASYRFERGTDMNMVEYTSMRAAALIEQLAGGTIEGYTDNYPKKLEPIEVSLDPKYVKDLIDIDLTDDEIISLLAKVEIKLTGKEGSKLKFLIPEFRRNDIAKDYDLVEEVTRLYGYEKVESDNSFSIHPGIHSFNDEYFRFEKKMRDYLIGAHYNEIVTSSLLDSKKLQVFEIEPVRLSNPGSVEMNTMRTGMEAGILMSIKNNVNHLGKDISLKFFEMGRVFRKVGGADKNTPLSQSASSPRSYAPAWERNKSEGSDTPMRSETGASERENNNVSNATPKFIETNLIGITLYGNYDLNYYSEAQRKFDIFDLKGEVEILLQFLNIRNLRFIFKKETGTIEILSGKEKLGLVKIIDKKIAGTFDLDTNDKILYAELDIEKLFAAVNKNIKFCEISRFPAVKRDLAFVVEKNVVYKDIEDIILKSAGKLLSDLSVFDVYEDNKLGENKRSIALNLEFSSNEKTLTDKEISSSVEKIISDLEKKLSVTLRS